MTLETFLGHFRHVRRARRGWTARCPAHDDRSCNTLAIALGRDGRRLVKCWAGCDLADILAGAELDRRDLFEAPLARASHARRLPPDAPPSLRELIRDETARRRRILTPGILELYAASDLHRLAMRRADQLRAQATALGDTDEAWTLLERAAALDTLRAALADALDQVVQDLV